MGWSSYPSAKRAGLQEVNARLDGEVVVVDTAGVAVHQPKRKHRQPAHPQDPQKAPARGRSILLETDAAYA